jgi:ATP-dependent Clp protease ATP-binding subunit ClpC
MPAYRFPTLVWRDPGGICTALPVEAANPTWVGVGSSPRAALEQLRDFLKWLAKRGEVDEPDLTEAELRTFKVPVRPEYTTHNRIYACNEVWLSVPCVSGKTTTGLLVAALPLLGARFYYHDPKELKHLVIRYTQQNFKGMSPREVARFLPPTSIQLQSVIVRVPAKHRHGLPRDARWPALSQAAEPLGDRAVRKQFSPAWERGDIVSEIVRKLDRERTNLLLVGEPGVGKTTVLVEAVQRIERRQAEEAKRRDEPLESARTFWLTTAGRLIAGMKYLGQWEQRCEHIINELARMPGCLVVDRLLDLLRLGGAGPVDSLAAFLMPYLQRGELRLIGEATPAELDACHRLLPGFADLFARMVVPPFDRPQALAVLDHTTERHAQNLRLMFEPGVSDRVWRLFRRFAPYQSFPGAAVGFLRELCERHARENRDRPVVPDDVVRQFIRRTGLPEWLLRDELVREEAVLRTQFREHVIGQDEGVDAAVRLVTTFKAGLNDPRRPIGVLLFCGPTGVGKTELARTLSRVLFGHGEAGDRLVRLDMSEYAGPGAVNRLLGSPHDEAGMLVRRLRQQPFCVVLFDEIEKAGDEVFDVLLGVCDEGRLTDPFGRTTDFRSAVVIMTSNLGAEQRQTFGLGPAAPPTYTDVARQFFRPEFFNRLDAVVTFQPLLAATIDAITRKELAEVGQREGFVRAGLRLNWSDAVVAWLAKEGFDARFGARPLQRVLENRVVAPLARYLLHCPDLTRVTICLDYNSEEGLSIRA